MPAAEVTLVIRVEKFDDELIEDMRTVIENSDWEAILVEWDIEEV